MLNIIRGKKQGAIRAVIYGTEGIGKSTLAAQIPDSLIIDTEDGSGQIDAARVLALDWRAIEHALKELIAEPQGFKAIIIDTADWLEKALIEHVLRQAGKKSIEDFGYGKGYTILQEHVVRFLAQVDQLIAKGIHVVFVAHAKVTRTSPPDQTDGYDRFELKLTKQVAPLLKEWADLVLFCNYRIQIVEGSDGKLKAQGGRERIMHAVHSAAWDAKNRFGLADEMPMEFKQIAALFTSAQPRTTAPAAAPAKAPAVVEQNYSKLASEAELTRITALKTQATEQILEEYLERFNAINISDLTSEQALELIASMESAIQAEIAKQTAAPVFPATVATWLEQNEEAANAYLAHVKWITAGQTWRDLTADKANTIADKFAKFSGAVTNHAKTGRKAA
jgi:hypothetical protein